MEKQTLHITTAHGPAECQLAAGKIVAEMLKEFRQEGLLAEVLQRTQGHENGTLVSAVIQVQGKNVKTFTKPWIGTILWIQKSPYRPNHGRKNWFVGVFELEHENNFSWNEKDFQIQAIRSSGAGGQHVNKVSSAVRITHLPTGISILVQDSRSQLQNKKIAMKRMEEKLLQIQEKKTLELAENKWNQQVELERGNPVKTFTGMQLKPRKPEKTFKSKRAQLKNELKKELKL
jgi:peptide chain release factor